MAIYKLIFANNTISSCEILNRNVKLDGAYYYEHSKEKLIYALIKADNEEEAMLKGYEIIEEVLEKFK